MPVIWLMPVSLRMTPPIIVMGSEEGPPTRVWTGKMSEVWTPSMVSTFTGSMSIWAPVSNTLLLNTCLREEFLLMGMFRPRSL